MNPKPSPRALTSSANPFSAVTSRLEDVATSQSSQAPTSSLRSGTGGAHDLVAGHVAPSSSAPPPPPPPPPAAAPSEAAPSPAVKAYQDDIIDGPLAELLSASKNIGGVVEQHVGLLLSSMLNEVDCAVEGIVCCSTSIPAARFATRQTL